jgi:hypothetical protein
VGVLGYNVCVHGKAAGVQSSTDRSLLRQGGEASALTKLLGHLLWEYYYGT